MYAKVNGTEIYFDVEGAGLVPDGEEMKEKDVCFVLHGGPAMDHTYFKPYLSPLADDMQLIYVDHRNSGRSARIAVESCTIEQMADDVEALRHQEAIKNLILITTSPSYDFYEAAKAEVARKGSPEQIAAVPDVFEGRIDNDEALGKWWKIMNPLYYHRWDDKYWEGEKRGRGRSAGGRTPS